MDNSVISANGKSLKKVYVLWNYQFVMCNNK